MPRIFAGAIETVIRSAFDISPDRGFLPVPDPVGTLPAQFKPWEETGRDLPKLLAAGRVRVALDELPELDAGELSDEPGLQRAMLLLSYFGHAYVWGGRPPADRIPPGIAIPWCKVAARLGRPPVLSYASYALSNWRRFDPRGPIALGNIALRQNFLGGVDEEWFVLVHVEIEAEAAPAIAAIGPAQRAVLEEEPGKLERQLDTIAAALERMHETLLRMRERCDPYIYFHRVRPYIHGWKDHPELPQGVLYEGVGARGGRWQELRGETGAQSAIIPALDAALGIEHAEDPLRVYLAELRDYMPPPHRRFVATVAEGPSIRQLVSKSYRRHPSLREAYNQCVRLVSRFRATHLEYAGRYIFQQAQLEGANPTDVGTGGTPFMPYLKKHLEETERWLV